MFVRCLDKYEKGLDTFLTGLNVFQSDL